MRYVIEVAKVALGWFLIWSPIWGAVGLAWILERDK